MKHILSLLGNKFPIFIFKLRLYYSYILNIYGERIKKWKSTQVKEKEGSGTYLSLSVRKEAIFHLRPQGIC